MRIVLRFLAFLCPIIALAIFGSFKVMEKLEQQWVRGDLSRRSTLISESVHEYLAENLIAGKHKTIERLLNRMSRDERLVGALVCSPAGTALARSEAVPAEIQCDPERVANAGKTGTFLQTAGRTLHQAVLPITTEEQTAAGYLIVLHDTKYMSQRHDVARKYIVGMVSALAVLFLVLALGLYRWTLTKSVSRIKNLFKVLLTGEDRAFHESIKKEFFPLARDLTRVMRELRHAKTAIKDTEAANLWTPSRLRGDVQKNFGDMQFCVIANREPYVHNRKGSQVEVLFPASGLVTAVEPIVRACSGLWIGHGSGTADRETADSSGKLLVPPGEPEYALKRVWLSKAEEKGYYYGFSNEGLWPLCHIAHARPSFDSDDYAAYRTVNEKFAKAFIEESADSSPIALIQDYHFALLPEMIRARKPDALLSLFWHIPWPNPEAFGICPWKKELLRGMLGSDLIGFHTQYHCNNFLDTVDRFLEARVDREQFSVTIQGHVCYVKPFSISVEWPPRHDIPVEDFAKEREELLSELNLPKHIKMGVGVDRVDYTKGLIERLRSVEKLLDDHPELVGNFVFVQIGAPSRTHIKRYQDLNSEVQEVADQINWKFDRAEVPPIMLRLSHHNASEIYRYYRAADVCFVSSLHDGMNLVAKEYVSARSDRGGALVLSTFAGASRELTDALLVNPYDLEECAGALYRALTMPDAERRQRMERLRSIVSERNVYAWAGSYLAEIHRIAQLKGGLAGTFGTQAGAFP